MTDHLARPSSGSGGASALDDAAKSVEMADEFTHAQDLAGLEQINNSLHPSTFTAGAVQTDFHRHPEIPSSLFEWYQRNDGPWTGLVTQVDDGPPPTLANLRAHHIFQYRDNIAPSESSTILPSDSGYGSYGAKHSVTNNSVCDETFERNTETQSVIEPMHALNFSAFGSQEMVPRTGLDHGIPWQLAQGAPKFNHHESQLNGSNIICKICNKVLKTNSELKKHTQRHTKPYVCDVSGCTRREGFSTSNDLDRHKRSVHPDIGAAGNRYVCPISSCKSKGKVWPRADNFRAHLKRVHQNDVSDEQLEQYITKPLSQPPSVISDLAREDMNTAFTHFPSYPQGTNNVPGNYCPLPQNEIIELSTESSPTEHPTRNTHIADALTALENTSRTVPPLPRSSTSVSSTVSEDTETLLDPLEKTAEEISTQDLQAIEQGEYLQPAKLSRGGVLLSDTGKYQSRDQENSIVSPGGEAGENLGGSHNESDRSSVTVDSLGPLKEVKEVGCDTHESPEPCSEQNTQPGLHAVDLNDQTDIVRLLETLQNNGLLKKLGYKKESSVEPDTKTTETAISFNQELPHRCSQCTKTFNRRCELKKHEKRHAKPYGCTFPGCSKKFGSKNDWKRHENSQHFMLEVWRCDVQRIDLPSEVCGKVAHRLETFKVHLQACHGMDDWAVETKLESCRIGRNCEARFWCGFCESTISIKQRGLGAWSERFDHIDDHFAGRNNLSRKEIGDWKNVDPEQPGKDLSAPDSDDSDRSPSPPLEAFRKPDGAFAGRSGKQAGQGSKTKRQKKAADSDARAPKRRRFPPTIYCFSCCQCGDSMPETSRVCTNFPCDHKLCARCTRSAT